MAYTLEIEPGDILLVPPDSGANIKVIEKSGRKTKLSVQSAKRVEVIKASDAAGERPVVPRPQAQINAPPIRRPE
jgi:hypothetical protein